MVELRNSHSRELDETRQEALKQGESDTRARMEELVALHAEETNLLRKQCEEYEKQIDQHLLAANSERKLADGRTDIMSQVQKGTDHQSGPSRDNVDSLKEIQMKFKLAEAARAVAESSLSILQAKLEEATWAKSELNNELKELRDKEERASRLVEELESQISNTYEETKDQSSRMSMIQT